MRSTLIMHLQQGKTSFVHNLYKDLLTKVKSGIEKKKEIIERRKRVQETKPVPLKILGADLR